jgi:hypothetical protein
VPKSLDMQTSDGTLIDKNFRGNDVTNGMVANQTRSLGIVAIHDSSPISRLTGRLIIQNTNAPPMTSAIVPSPRYRAYDPIFGPIGTVPVTEGAIELSTSEYIRLH